MPDNSANAFDVLVVGGGPAGIAAGVRAAESGVRVGIIDDNATLGGQIWRSAFSDASSHAASSNAASSNADGPAKRWRERLVASSVVKLCGLRIVDHPQPGTLLAEGNDAVCEARFRTLIFRSLILATGAREFFLPFPGWTLPNVMGAGGLQAMVKSGLPIRGKRVVIAGTGPLLLAVAAYLRQHGAEIPIVCEQAPWHRLLSFGLALTTSPAKMKQALRLKRELSGVDFAPGSWPVEAHGQQKLEGVTICRDGRRETIPCDYLACGFHLVPNTELPQLLGCKLQNGFVQIDDLQQTSVAGIFCAGEPTGIGGVELAICEGQIAGLAATGHADEAKKLLAERNQGRRFARLLDRTFRLRSELKNLARADTFVCRCEDVSYTRLHLHNCWRAAKLQTRCGMGPCQGRICGPAVQFIFGWNPDSVRPPIFPARVASLAAMGEPPGDQATAPESGRESDHTAMAGGCE